MEKFEKIVGDIKVNVMPNFVLSANLEIESEIILRVIGGAFPANCGQKTFRELCETEIQGRYDRDKNKIENHWWFPAFNFGDVIDYLIEESLENNLHDFIDECVKRGKYKELFEEYKLPSPDDDFYRDFVTELVCDIHFEDGIFTTRENIKLWEENPTVEGICNKYSEQIEQFRKAEEEYWQKRREWEKEKKSKLAKIAEDISNPNIQQKITKNDKDLLKFLKENYSPQEIGLLIWAGKLEVSQKVSMMFPAPKVNYPQSSPSLSDFLNGTTK